jgi:outer membrane protein assembly factor BamB
VVVATGGEGSVAAIDLQTVRALWLIQLLDAVVATPTISNSTVYIAGTDQYLRAIDLYSGRSRWKYLTTSELTDSPVVVGDTLYQRIPGEGLTSFSAFAPDITGEKHWTAKDVEGVVVTTSQNKRLICWDSENRILQEVDPRLGSITATLELPRVKELLVDAPKNGNLFLITDDDAIIKIIPRLKK